MSIFNPNTNPAAAGPAGVFRRGAEDGLWFGLYLSVIIVGSALSTGAWLLGMLAVLMAVLVPVVVYKALRRSYKAGGCRASFAEVWMQGICTFFFGSLIMALVAYVGLRWIDPGFIAQRISEAAEVYRSIGTETGDEMARTFDLMIEKHMVPGAINIAFSLLWSAVFTGSLLSLVLAPIVRRPARRQPTVND